MKKYKLWTDKLDLPLIMLIFFILMSCLSCTNDLSRGKAKEILSTPIQVIDRRIPFILSIATIWGPPRGLQFDRNQEEGMLMERLREGGYVDLEINKEYDLVITPKDKLKPYIYKSDKYAVNIFIAEAKIDEITGITQVPMDASVREVQYKIKIVPNELSKIFTLTGEEKTDTTRRAYIRKFDDGWRREKSH